MPVLTIRQVHRPGGEKLYYHLDRLGSTRMLTDSTGNIKGLVNYDAWGAPKINNSVVTNSQTADLLRSYTGHTYDSVLNMYFAQARMYDPNSKRFTAADPAQHGLNLYEYCNNSPLVYVDPDGEVAILAAMATGAIIGGLVGGAVDLGTQLWKNRGTDNKVNWKSVGVSALAGAAGGALGGGVGAALTGLVTGGSAGALSAVGLTAAQAIGISAASGVAYGIGSRAVYYLFEPCPPSWASYVLNPKEMVTDAVVSGATAGVFHGANMIGLNDG